MPTADGTGALLAMSTTDTTSPVKWIVTERASAGSDTTDAQQRTAHTHGFNGFNAFNAGPFAWLELDRIDAGRRVERSYPASIRSPLRRSAGPWWEPSRPRAREGKPHR